MRSCSTRYGPTSPWTRQSSEDRLRCGGDFNRAWGSGTRDWELQSQSPVPSPQSQNVSRKPTCAERYCALIFFRYCDGVLSSVPTVQFGRSKTLKTSAMPSIATRPRSGNRCCTRTLVEFCGGEMIELRDTIVPFGRRRPLKVEPVFRKSLP